MSSRHERSVSSSNRSILSSINSRTKKDPAEENVCSIPLPSHSKEAPPEKPHFYHIYGNTEPVGVYSGHKHCFSGKTDEDLAVYRCIDMDQYVQNGIACPGSIRIWPTPMQVAASKPHNHAAGAPPSRTSKNLIRMVKERAAKNAAQNTQPRIISPTLNLPHVDMEFAQKSISILNSIPSLEEIRNALSPGPPESEVDVDVQPNRVSNSCPFTGTLRRPVIEDHRSERSASRSERFSSAGRQLLNDQASSSQNSQGPRRRRRKRAKNSKSPLSKSPSTSTQSPTAPSFSFFQSHIISLSDHAGSFSKMLLHSGQRFKPLAEPTQQCKRPRLSRKALEQPKPLRTITHLPPESMEEKQPPAASKKKPTTKVAAESNVPKRRRGRPSKLAPTLDLLQAETRRSIEAYLNSEELEPISSSNHEPVSEDSLPSDPGDKIPENPHSDSPEAYEEGTNDHEKDAVEACLGRMEPSSISSVVSRRRPNHPPLRECPLPGLEDIGRKKKFADRFAAHDESHEISPLRTGDLSSRTEVERASSTAIRCSANGQHDVIASPPPSVSIDPYSFPDTSPVSQQTPTAGRRKRSSRTASSAVSPAQSMLPDQRPSCSRTNYERSPQSGISTSTHSASPWTIVSSPANRQTPRSNCSILSPSQTISPAQCFVAVGSQSIERADSAEVVSRTFTTQYDSPRASDFRQPYQRRYQNVQVFSPISPPSSEIGDLNDDDDLPLEELVTESAPNLPELSPADVIAGLEETDTGSGRPGSSNSLASFTELLRHLTDPTLPSRFGSQISHYNSRSTNPTGREITDLSCIKCQRHVDRADKATEAAFLPEEPRTFGATSAATVPQFAVPFTPPAVSGADARLDVAKTCMDLEETLSKLVTHLESEPDDAIDKRDTVTQSLSGLIAKAKDFLDRQAIPQPKIIARTPRYAVVFDSDYTYGF
ncbi:hypothetical protein RvY_14703-2 [Ramazzottius varieornatus]|uniref:Uncharacterized protein n=1 Tax=Ramazzottius varieornatus TaxID=947166 RepID=A0A1D1VS88_RAMVA|nr:hypothetical protein RvY_14703-2 [Ramazzottius varieornatus]